MVESLDETSSSVLESPMNYVGRSPFYCLFSKIPLRSPSESAVGVSSDFLFSPFSE